jgi:cephalosporin-C deacetylase
MKFPHILVAVLSAVTAVVLAQSEQVPSPPNTTTKVSVTCSKADGFAEINEDITFAGEVTDDKLPVAGKFLLLNLYKNGFLTTSKTVPSDQPYSITSRMEQPGHLMFEGILLDEKQEPVKRSHQFHNRNLNAGFGVLCSVDDIKTAVPIPDDFQSFWQRVKEEVAMIKCEATLTESALPDKYAATLICHDVQIPCAGGAPVSGYLVIPRVAGAKSLPAILTLHGAGVRSARKICDYGDKAICLDINAHGLPNGNDAKFYQQTHATTLQAYEHRGSEDRDKYYFRGMFQRVIQALEYLKSRPEWDGKNLIVYGMSQGGAQAIAAAALDADVTLCVATVPALCDHNADKVGRVPGWPKVVRRAAPPLVKKKIPVEVNYYDCAHLATMIGCETYMATGGVDNLCVPTSVAAAFNALPKSIPKGLLLNPLQGHNTPPVKGEQRVREILNATKQ